MKAKILVYALLALNLADIHLAEEQQGKVFHVGVLTIGDNSVHNCFVGRTRLCTRVVEAFIPRESIFRA
jgi:hypothetical protein